MTLFDKKEYRKKKREERVKGLTYNTVLKDKRNSIKNFDNFLK